MRGTSDCEEIKGATGEECGAVTHLGSGGDLVTRLHLSNFRGESLQRLPALQFIHVLPNTHLPHLLGAPETRSQGLNRCSSSKYSFRPAIRQWLRLGCLRFDYPGVQGR
jgi:hypothetical protein